MSSLETTIHINLTSGTCRYFSYQDFIIVSDISAVIFVSELHICISISLYFYMLYRW